MALPNAPTQAGAGTPVQAVLGWHSTSPHTPLMTCSPEFEPYCCGAFLTDPDGPGDSSLCDQGKKTSRRILQLRSADGKRVVYYVIRSRTGGRPRGVRDTRDGASADWRCLRPAWCKSWVPIPLPVSLSRTRFFGLMFVLVGRWPDFGCVWSWEEVLGPGRRRDAILLTRICFVITRRGMGNLQHKKRGEAYLCINIRQVLRHDKGCERRLIHLT